MPWCMVFMLPWNPAMRYLVKLAGAVVAALIEPDSVAAACGRGERLVAAPAQVHDQAARQHAALHGTEQSL